MNFYRSLMLRAIILAIVSVSLAPAQSDYQRPVSWIKLVPNILSDQKEIWTYPARAFKRKNIVPTMVFLGATASLIAADPYEGKYFHGTNSYHGLNQAFSSTNSSLIILAVPVAMYASGLIAKDSKLKETALLSGEAVADSEILATVFKAGFHRARPSSFQPGQNNWDSWFDGSASSGSFPSGHTIAAFSVATVVAREYGSRHRWVPFAAYGVASVIGFSRLTLSAHFTSDVFVGAALGYVVSRFAVLRN